MPRHSSEDPAQIHALVTRPSLRSAACTDSCCSSIQFEQLYTLCRRGGEIGVMRSSPPYLIVTDRKISLSSRQLDRLPWRRQTDPRLARAFRIVRRREPMNDAMPDLAGFDDDEIKVLARLRAKTTRRSPRSRRSRSSLTNDLRLRGIICGYAGGFPNDVALLGAMTATQLERRSPSRPVAWVSHLNVVSRKGCEWVLRSRRASADGIRPQWPGQTNPKV
jgi:hypothetical protein